MSDELETKMNTEPTVFFGVYPAANSRIIVGLGKQIMIDPSVSTDIDERAGGWCRVLNEVANLAQQPHLATIATLTAERDQLEAALTTEREITTADHNSGLNLAHYCDDPSQFNLTMSGNDIIARDTIKELRKEIATWKREAEVTGRFEMRFINELNEIKKIVGHDESGPTLVEHVTALCDELAGLKAGNHGLKFDAEYQRGRANALEKEIEKLRSPAITNKGATQ